MALGVAACSASSDGGSHAGLGYGTPGVSSDVSGADATDLLSLQARCRRVRQTEATTGQMDGLPAACAQLQRTAGNQPGNAVQPNPIK